MTQWLNETSDVGIFIHILGIFLSLYYIWMEDTSNLKRPEGRFVIKTWYFWCCCSIFSVESRILLYRCSIGVSSWSESRLLVSHIWPDLYASHALSPHVCYAEVYRCERKACRQHFPAEVQARSCFQSLWALVFQWADRDCGSKDV